MKKNIALGVAFLIVSAVMTGIAYAVGYLFDLPSLYEDGAAFVIGLSAGLGGTFGPIIFAALTKK